MKEQSINNLHKVTQPAGDSLNPESLALVVMMPLLTMLYCLSGETHAVTFGPRAMAFGRKWQLSPRGWEGGAGGGWGNAIL